MIGRGRSMQQLGRRDEAVGNLRAADALAREIGNPQRQAQARAALADIGETATSALPDGLTGRQAEVLGLLAAGLSNKQIAPRSSSARRPSSAIWPPSTASSA